MCAPRNAVENQGERPKKSAPDSAMLGGARSMQGTKQLGKAQRNSW